MPIPGTTKLHRLEENLGSTEVELTADDLREIDAAASRIDLKGERLPEGALKMTGVWIARRKSGRKDRPGGHSGPRIRPRDDHMDT